MQGDKPGMASAGEKPGETARRVYSEQALYRQLCYFRRQLDPRRVLAKIPEAAKQDEAAAQLAPVRAALEAGAQAALKLQEANAYHWVDLRKLCQV